MLPRVARWMPGIAGAVVLVAVAILVNLITAPDVRGGRLLLLIAALAGFIAAQVAVERWNHVQETSATRGAAEMDLGRLLRLSTPSGPPLVESANAEEAGVAHSRSSGPLGKLRTRPYVPRDVDQALELALRRELVTVVVGEAAAGKSRTAFEACRRVFGHRVLLVPANRAAVAGIVDALHREALPRESVIWLDDLELFLGSDGLTAELLARLRRFYPAVCVVATMRTTEWESALSEQEETRAARVLRQTRGVMLAAHLSDAELGGCGRLYADADHDFMDQVDAVGLGPLLVGAPELSLRLDLGLVNHPAGAAVIRAAADWRRAGLAWPVPALTLEVLHGGYAAEGSYDEGLAWALQPVVTDLALLTPVGDDGYRVPDFIVDRFLARGESIPAATWVSLIDLLSPTDLIDIGWQALERRDKDIARRAFERSRAANPSDACVGLAFTTMLEGGGLSDAEPLLREAAGLGDSQAAGVLGQLLADAGREGEAEEYLRSAAAAGWVNGLVGLGRLLLERGDLAESERLFLDAEEKAHGSALYELALLGYTRGTSATAREYAERAYDQGHPGAAGLRGALAEEGGDRAEAEHWYRLGAARGDPAAMSRLGGLLRANGDLGAAERWLRDADAQGEPHAAVQLGDLLMAKGKRSEAVRAWTRAAEAGDARAIVTLGRYLVDRGRVREGEDWLAKVGGQERETAVKFGHGAMLLSEQAQRRSAKAGNVHAACQLGYTLYRAGNEEEGARWLRSALADGHLHAGETLAALLLEQHDDDHAIPILEEAAALGSGWSMVMLGKVYSRRGRRHLAEQWAREAVARDAPGARTLLGSILMHQVQLFGRRRSTRAREAEKALREAADGGDMVAATLLGHHLDNLRRYDEARQWWLKAARNGEPLAASSLGSHLVNHGQVTEGEAWLRYAADRGVPLAKKELVTHYYLSGRPRAADDYLEGTRKATQ